MDVSQLAVLNTFKNFPGVICVNYKQSPNKDNHPHQHLRHVATAASALLQMNTCDSSATARVTSFSENLMISFNTGLSNVKRAFCGCGSHRSQTTTHSSTQGEPLLPKWGHHDAAVKYLQSADIISKYFSSDSRGSPKFICGLAVGEDKILGFYSQFTPGESATDLTITPVIIARDSSSAETEWLVGLAPPLDYECVLTESGNLDWIKMLNCEWQKSLKDQKTCGIVSTEHAQRYCALKMINESPMGHEMENNIVKFWKDAKFNHKVVQK